MLKNKDFCDILNAETQERWCLALCKILFADKTEGLVKPVRQMLPREWIYRSCSDGEKVLELCRSFQPDILYIDLDLPRLDGIGVLRAVRALGLNVDVIATSVCAQSNYVMQTLVSLGVQYILPKPCTAAAVAARMQEIAVLREGREWTAYDEINSLLLSFGFKMSLGGYPCIQEAILSYMKEGSRQITKTVYPEVAAKCGGSAGRVERAIRCAIFDAWKRREEPVWRMFFTPERDGKLQCPSNSYFISRVALCLRNRKIS